jgi:hypothetical protein
MSDKTVKNRRFDKRAEALRDNLLKRKKQVRARSDEPKQEKK